MSEGKLEANFSYLRPYLRVIVLNMAATRKQWSMFKPKNSFATVANAKRKENPCLGK